MYYHTNHSLFERSPPPSFFPLNILTNARIRTPLRPSLSHSLTCKMMISKIALASSFLSLPPPPVLFASHVNARVSWLVLRSEYQRSYAIPVAALPHPAPALSLSRARAHSHAHREIRTFTSARKVCWNPISRNARA